MRLHIALIWIVLTSCRRSSSVDQDAGSPTNLDANAHASPSMGAIKHANEDLTPESSDAASPRLTNEIDWKHATFTKYVHARCGEVNETAANSECAFALDVPSGMRKVTSAATDGRCFRSGQVELSGWAYPSNVVPFCKKVPSAKVHQKKKSSCWQTGETGGSIFWHREILEGSTIYVLHLDYPATMKAEMDAIIGHINASWHHPLNESDKGVPSDEHEDAKGADSSGESTVTYDFDTGKNTLRGNPFECP